MHDGVERLLEDEIEIMITVLSREPTYIFRKRHFPSRLPAPLILDPDEPQIQMHNIVERCEKGDTQAPRPKVEPSQSRAHSGARKEVQSGSA